eukprot:gnl/MRDRNA2_/MRDRNA2_86012_c0_seq1.p1 gnl/MRDRNA2_/MRDRNA2_86012_c0~~gnl/MRDRNA2_/MRDRNA2_86012_c0_seq1.p1  ORF type:complete len:131 (-),score=17.83 gnl/MRDRNA2_/MRDRNA2_86012_c0_seq1:99-491(-)
MIGKVVKLIAFAAFSDIAWSLKLQITPREVNKSSDARAHIFFINLENEKDRCHCVAAQLDKAPWPVTRIEAESPGTMITQCEELFHENETASESLGDSEKRKPTAVESALYCSIIRHGSIFMKNQMQSTR